MRRWFGVLLFLGLFVPMSAEAASRVVDLPTRPGVTQRMLVIVPEAPKAAAILIAGGHGGLQLSAGGRAAWGEGNFLVRTRDLFAANGVAVAVVDAPSDRQSGAFLNQFRQTAEHVADLKATIAWLRRETGLPVWLIGTSRGTQSAAFAAIQLAGGEGPDGVVLTSTILTDERSRTVPRMAVNKIAVPVLVVHHEQDGCQHCKFRDIAALMNKLTGTARKELIAVTGGVDQGDPCEPRAYHGFNGLEREVVGKIAVWMTAK